MIRILDEGVQTTVQDLGRRGALRFGIPQSGPMDRAAFLLANRLVGNSERAAGLECTYLGPRFEVGMACAMAVTGATVPLTVNGQEAPMWTTVPLQPGDVVKLGVPHAGVRSYIAFSGGIDVPVVMGSRATYLRGRLGGVEGRPVRRQDMLALLPGRVPPLRRVRPEAMPALEENPVVRVVLGPQADRFTPAGIAAFLEGPYEVLPQSDRMGARLRGPRIEHARGHDIISDGIALGSIQVPGDGQPIVLLVDRQSAGGYTKVATVCSFDIRHFGQIVPEAMVTFRAIDLAEAHGVHREARASLEHALTDQGA